MSTATIAKTMVRDAVRSALAQPPKESVSEWAANHRRIVAQEAAEPGAWRNERTPYLRGIMDAFNDPGVTRISIMKAERVGGSETVLNILGYIIDRAPGPVLYIYPTEDIAFEVNRKRVLPTIKRTPALMKHMTGRPWDARLLDLQLDRMSIAFRGSNSEGKLEALGFKYVIVDELDRCAPNVLDIVHGRGAANPGFKLIDVSTPELEWSGDPSDRTQGIDRSFKEGDQRRLWVPCPRCGEYHTRTFHKVKWIGGLDSHPDDVEKGAYMICPNPRCQEQIRGHHTMEQLQRCVWVPRGWSVGVDGVLTNPKGETSKAAGGVYVPTGASHASFAIHGLYSPFKANAFGYLAREFVKNRGETTREFVNRRLGEGWSTKGQRLEKGQFALLKGYGGNGNRGSGIGNRTSGIGGGGDPTPDSRIPTPDWRLGTAPADVAVLTAFADIQANRIYLEVIGWDAACEREWLVDFQVLPREVGDGLAALRAYGSAKWPVVDMATGEMKRRQTLSILGIDSGHYTDEVYDFVRPRQGGKWAMIEREGKDRDGKALPPVIGGPHVIATKGVPGGIARGIKPFDVTIPERDMVGARGSAAAAPRPDAVRLVLIDTWHFKRIIRDQVAADAAIERRRRAAALKAAALAAGRPWEGDDVGSGMSDVGCEDQKPEQGSRGAGGAGERGGGSSPSTSDIRHPTSHIRKLFYPDDTPDSYFEMLTSEESTTSMVRGRLVTAWKMIPGRSGVGNHALDCRVGNKCLVKAMRVAERIRK